MKVSETAARRTVWAPGACVLVTDDNVMNLAVIRGLLKRTGVQLYVASSGAETLALVREHKFDIVFLDHMMPEMDGIETYREIRRLWTKGEELKTTKNTPFLILTANAVAGAKEMYLQEGFYDYISKPVDAIYLEKMLRKYLPKEYVEIKEETSQMLNEDFPEPVRQVTVPAEEAGEMTEYFRVMSNQRKEELARKIIEEDMRGICLLLHDMRCNVQAMGQSAEAESFVSIITDMEKTARDGAIDLLREKQPVLMEVWEKFELGVAV